MQAFKAYNEAPAALVTKQGKRGKVKELDLKQYAPVLDYKNRGDGALAVSLVLPAGGQLTVSPSLLVGWLCAHAPLQAHQVQILRTELLTGENGKIPLKYRKNACNRRAYMLLYFSVMFRCANSGVNAKH